MTASHPWLVQLDATANRTAHWPMGACKPNLIKHNHIYRHLPIKDLKSKNNANIIHVNLAHPKMKVCSN